MTDDENAERRVNGRIRHGCGGREGSNAPHGPAAPDQGAEVTADRLLALLDQRAVMGPGGHGSGGRLGHHEFGLREPASDDDSSGPSTSMRTASKHGPLESKSEDADAFKRS